MKTRHLVLIAIALAAGSAAMPARAAATVPAAPTAPALAAAVPSAVAASVTSAAAIQEEGGGGGFMDVADRAMGRVNAVISAVLFFDMIFWDNTVAPDGTVNRGREFPFVVLWLIVAAIFLTVRMGFINLRGFRHAIHVTAGKYTSPDAPGDMSHFAALSTALSATVGLGNIAGVAIAIMIGGPGATVWMIIAGLFGMTLKMTECTLAQMYRETRPDGTVLGGPMQYLARGLAEKGSPRFGKALAVLFAIMCIGGSIAGGNSFQVNQSMGAVAETIPIFESAPWAYGLLMVVLVGIVMVGGVRRLANVADKIAPMMCAIYVLGCLTVIIMNAAHVPGAFGEIFRQAIAPDAAFGGFIGVIVQGFRRAAFSNEAGAGSAPIAHSAAKTQYPVREGIVALLEPFIDTVVVCTMTALVINITGAYNNPAYADIIAAREGAALTSRAFGEQISWFPYVLSLAVFLFAYSTMLSWSYYGERCTVWLFGERASKYYKALFLTFAFLGSIITARNVLEFGDLMILGMSVPNLIGVYLLHGKVKAALDDYWRRYKAGEFPVYEKRREVRKPEYAGG